MNLFCVNTEELKLREGNTYDYGLLASRIQNDKQHELRCREGIVYTLGES